MTDGSTSCDIFVHGTDAADLAATVSAVVGRVPQAGPAGVALWMRDGVRVEAAPNPHAGRAGFRGWRWLVRVSATDAAPPRERMVGLVSAVLETLWRRDVYAVADCVFADELPRRGGTGWLL